MSSQKLYISAIVAVIAVASGLAYRQRFVLGTVADTTSKKKHIPSPEKIPLTLTEWRKNMLMGDDTGVWSEFRGVLQDAGVMLWPHSGSSFLKRKPSPYIRPNGYAYVTPSRGLDDFAPGSGRQLTLFEYSNDLKRPATLQNGQDGIVRIVVLRETGHTHLNILRKIATEPLALLTHNHVLPMLTEIRFDPVTFCVFPLVGGESMRCSYSGLWAKSSVGDLLDMIMQALEGLAFIHDLKIAHRDAFSDNFLVEWQPESLRTMTVPTTRPRVYMNDFETAVMFEPDTDPSECTCIGCPMGNPDTYTRPMTPEILKEEPYDPFKLDVWQLGVSLVFETTIAPIDEIIASMWHGEDADRPTAREVLSRLSTIVHSIAPQSLLIPPVLLPDSDGDDAGV
ncbi:kinase-like protein [Dentipellis sp. KUC8613]|nr:kinase-like protein [Dentipellis sp. KUC8613]